MVRKETIIRLAKQFHYMATENEKDPMEQINMFLRRNFPQIQMHGGESSVLDVDEETGEVTIALSGACSGCGISPMTTQEIKRRLVQQIDWVENVNVSAGGGGGFGEANPPEINTDVLDNEESDEENTGPDAPF
jgi:Fe-S cluster biogenesis protein NfuA